MPVIFREAFVDEGETNHGKCVVWSNVGAEASATRDNRTPKPL